jgi:hypothetical protein
MDPDANLSEQSTTTDPDRLRELRHALYTWLDKGGFPPVWIRHWSASQDFEAWCAENRLAWPPWPRPSDRQAPPAIRNYPYELVVRFTHEAPLLNAISAAVRDVNATPGDKTAALRVLFETLYDIGAEITQVHVQTAPDQVQRVKDRRQFKARQ